MRLAIAVDKFRGTASAQEVSDTIASVAGGAGWHTTTVRIADGGEGLLEVFGGPTMSSRVHDPLGREVKAEWLLDGDTAVIECARASGLSLVGGLAGNDPVGASSRGTGELIAAAIESGAREVVIGLGGSATTDGGMGAIEALTPHLPAIRYGEVSLIVCHDVETRYLDAAAVFGPQKGATPEQVALLTARLSDQRLELMERFGRDPQEFPGSGAAGGLGGAFAALGARLVSGFEYVASRVRLDDALAEADLVITGEGKFDRTSLEGKAVGGVLHHARALGVPAAVVAGVAETQLPGTTVVSLSDEFGADRAWHELHQCLATVTERLLAEFSEQRQR